MRFVQRVMFFRARAVHGGKRYCVCVGEPTETTLLGSGLLVSSHSDDLTMCRVLHSSPIRKGAFSNKYPTERFESEPQPLLVLVLNLLMEHF